VTSSNTAAVTPSAATVNDTDTKSLSSGAIAGIAIGAAAAVALIIAGMFILWRRRKTSEVRPGELGTASADLRPVSELPSPPVAYGEIKPVYQPAGTYELGGAGPGPDPVYEMPGR